MSKEEKNSIEPKLRFKQLNGQFYPAWDEVKLSYLARLITRKNKKSEITRVLTNSAVHGVVDQRDFFEKDIANQNNLDGYYIIKLGDYVYNPRVSNIAPVGPISKNKIGDGVMSPLYIVFRFIAENNDFYEQYFRTSHWHKYLRFVSNNGARFDRMSITPSVFMGMPVPLPFPEEQQKIASCFSSLDELINAHSLKLEALKAHKKGLIQQLFPVEGETVPKLRFKEFKGNGSWKVKLLGDIGDVLMCKRIFAEETNVNEGIPFYKIGTLGGKPDAFINRNLFEEYKSKYSYPRTGEILITCSGTVGRCLVYDGKDAYYQDSNIVWIDNPNLEIRNELLYYLISSVRWNILNSTTITRIYGPDLRNLKLTFPQDAAEQLKIATCLSTIDEQISLKDQKIDILKKHRIGLTQVLFPY